MWVFLGGPYPGQGGMRRRMEVRRWCDGEEVRKNGENVGFFELVRTVTDVFTAF